MASMGVTKRAAASFVRPADTTAYAAGDAVNNSTTAPVAMVFTNIASDGRSGYVVGGKIVTDNETVTNGSFRLYLFTASPTMANDNAAYGLLYSERASLVGYLDFTLFVESVAGTNAAVAFETVSRLPFVSSPGFTIYGLLVAKGAYVPTSAQNVHVEILAECN